MPTPKRSAASSGKQTSIRTFFGTPLSVNRTRKLADSAAEDQPVSPPSQSTNETTGAAGTEEEVREKTDNDTLVAETTREKHAPANADTRKRALPASPGDPTAKKDKSELTVSQPAKRQRGRVRFLESDSSPAADDGSDEDASEEYQEEGSSGEEDGSEESFASSEEGENEETSDEEMLIPSSKKKTKPQRRTEPPTDHQESSREQSVVAEEEVPWSLDDCAFDALREDSGASPAAAEDSGPQQSAAVQEAIDASEKALAKLRTAREDHPRTRVDLCIAELQAASVYQFSAYFREYLDGWQTYHATNEFPSWLHPEKICDAEGRRPTDPLYDVTTIKVPRDASKSEKAHQTPALIQYWKIKEKNFDKIIFFKVGKFYEIFYTDATAAHNHLGLKWMQNDEKPHVGFPEVSMPSFAKQLVDIGFKVSVVEQMETPKELAERNKATAGPNEKTVRREICEVMTASTIVSEDLLKPQAKFFMVAVFQGHRIAYVFCDVSICQVHCGTVSDDCGWNKFRGLLARCLPVEVVLQRGQTHQDIISILRRLPVSPIITSLATFNKFAVPGLIEDKISDLRKQVGLDEDDKESVSSRLTVLFDESPLLQLAFGGLVAHLTDSLLDRRVLAFMKLNVEQETDQVHATNTPELQRTMPLDATLLTQLEVMTTSEGNAEMSLHHYLNRTCTAFGHREFTRWLLAPLTDPRSLEARLDCVEMLLDSSDLRLRLEELLKKLPDLERQLTRLWCQALQSERGAVYYNNLPHLRIELLVNLVQNFQSVLRDIREAFLQECQSVDNLPSGFATLLRRGDGGWPDLEKLTGFLEGHLVFGPLEGTASAIGHIVKDTWKPAPGVDAHFDEVTEKIASLVQELSIEKNRIASDLGVSPSSLSFVHSKFWFEVECSQSHVSKGDLRRYEQTSSKQGVVRFQSERLKTLVSDVQDRYQEQVDALYPVLKELLKSFYAFRQQFNASLRILATIDCLLALARVASDTSAGPMIRPTFLGLHEDRASLVLKNSRHPIVAAVTASFVPNDVQLNDPDDETSSAQCIAVTGPNMGGKSTLLRQTCLCVLMAQIGSFVPAEVARLTPVDRIFTRMGARDSIMEGKSTFLVEMEETAQMLQKATRYSLCVLDELGRGTSTFDGTAIASATLRDLTERVQCRCMFSTHYHLICAEIDENKDRWPPRLIANHHMAATVLGAEGRVAFLYKLSPGACPRSHGLHVARLAGLPEALLSLAEVKALAFEKATKARRGCPEC